MSILNIFRRNKKNNKKPLAEDVNVVLSATNENVIEKSAEEEILEMFNYIERKIEEYIEYDGSYIDIQNIYNRIKEKYFQEIKAYNENQGIKYYNETGNEIGSFKYSDLLLFARNEAIKELTNLRVRVDGIEYESKKKKIIQLLNKISAANIMEIVELTNQLKLEDKLVIFDLDEIKEK